MSHIDFSQVITAETRTTEVAEARQAHRKQECRDRIHEVIDATAQINLAAAAAAGVLTPEQMSVYRLGLNWIHAMREACGDDRSDDNWPPLPAEVAKLARQF
jgi:RES domain-containing protein